MKCNLHNKERSVAITIIRHHSMRLAGALWRKHILQACGSYRASHTCPQTAQRSTMDEPTEPSARTAGERAISQSPLAVRPG